MHNEQDSYYERLANASVNYAPQDQTDILYEEKAIDVGPVDECERNVNNNNNENAYLELNNYQVLLNEQDFSSSSDSDCLFSELASTQVDTLRNELMNRVNDKKALNQFFSYYNDELTLADVDDDDDDDDNEVELCENENSEAAKIVDKSLNRSRQSNKSGQLRSSSSINNRNSQQQQHQQQHQQQNSLSKQDSYNSIYFSFNKGQEIARLNNSTINNNNNNNTTNINASYLRNFEEGLDFTPVKDAEATVYNPNNENTTVIRTERKRAILDAANGFRQNDSIYAEKTRISTLMPPSFCLSPLKITKSPGMSNQQSTNMNNSTLTSDTDTSMHQPACCPLPLKKKWNIDETNVSQRTKMAHSNQKLSSARHDTLMTNNDDDLDEILVYTNTNKDQFNDSSKKVKFHI